MENFNPFSHVHLEITEASFAMVDNSWAQFALFFPYYRLYYVESGVAKIFMRDRTLELLPDHLYFIPAYSIMGVECQEIMSHYWIHFSVDVSLASYLTVYPPNLCIEAQTCDKEIFRLLIDKFNHPPKETDPSHTLACSSLAKYLFSRFLSTNNISSKASNFLPVLEYIDKNLSEPISNANLCKIMCLNETYFSNLFTQQFGISPKQYVLQKRIGSAATALLETNKTVKEIAASLGYDNEMYFNRIFHKITGCPPGKYRKIYRDTP